MKQFFQTLLLGFLVINLSGCPGGGSDSDDSVPKPTGNLNSSSGGGNVSSAPDPSTANSVSPAAFLGSLNSQNVFVDGLIASSNKSILTSGDSTFLTVVLADDNGVQTTDTAKYTFSSNCLSNGLSELNTNRVTNSDGTLQVTYTSQGCDSTDAITATAETATATFTASVSVETSNTAAPPPSTGASTVAFAGSTSDAGAFVPNLIKSSNKNVLFGGDQTTLTVIIADSNGNMVAEEARYVFSSPCINSGKSELDANFITNSSGNSSLTYIARGCDGSDPVTVEVTVAGQAFTASVDLSTRKRVFLGSFNSQNAFVDGKLRSSNAGTVYNSGTTNITYALTDVDGNLLTDTARIFFSSPCLLNGSAEIDNSVVTNTNGTATTTYTSIDCVGTDTVTATTEIDGLTLNASVDLTTDMKEVLFGARANGGVFDPSGSAAFVDKLIARDSVASVFSGNSTTLSIQLEDIDGTAITSDAVINFSSACVSNGTSSLSANNVANTSGTVAVTYTANGCSGDDTVTATTTVNDTSLTASVVVPTRKTALIGSYSGTGTFVNSAIKSSNTNTLVAGDSTELSVVIVDEDGEAVTDTTDIFFTSTCLSNGLADISEKVTTNAGGQATVTYTARGCNGADTVTANTTVANNPLSASVSLATEQKAVGGIAFVGVDRNQIGLKGTDALANQATITFNVTDSAGTPVPNQSVNFELSTDAGGITLDKTTGTTDGSGNVLVTVNAGTSHTPVRVKATAGSDSALSSALSITTGVPDQDSFTLAAAKLNLEGYNPGPFVGDFTTLTVRLADRYNNPVADNTAVNFIAEGGAVESQCLTANGVCTVVFTVQDPRPSDRRVTILATTVGEETFADANGNGVFDDGEPFDNVAEAFLDKNFDGTYTTGTGSTADEDILLDFDSNGAFTPANAFFEGVLCDESLNAQCNQANQESIHVRTSLELIMAGEGLNDSSISFSTGAINLVTAGGNASLSVSIVDDSGHPPPAGTTYSFSTTQGEIVLGDTNATQESTTVQAPRVFNFSIKPGASAGSGFFTVTGSTPSGNTFKASIPVNQT